MTTRQNIALLRYDFIISKYQSSLEFDDFMDRKGNGAYHDNYNVSEKATLTTTPIETDKSIWIITIIATVSIASLTVLVILKKRKQY